MEAILGAVYKKGLKLYTTLWKAGDTTEEPEANLVNASEMVRAFNEARTETDRADKARVVEIRALRKAEALAAESEAKAAATAAALATAMSNAQSATEDSEASPTDVVMQRGGRMVLRCQSEVGQLAKQYKVKLQDKINGPDAWKVSLIGSASTSLC